MKKSWLILCISALLFLILCSHAEAQIAIIVNKNNSISKLSSDDLKNIYLGKITSFSNNKRIILTEYAPLKEKFYKIVLDKSLRNVKKYWISFVLSGKSANPPIEYKDIDNAKSFVSQNNGAICFVNLSDVDKSVKVLTIDGKKPGDAKYFLQ
jgi:ABC-type phosphate transport system substrate-binding protein